MEDKYFISLDLEMNCGERGYNPCKIIQVGIAIGTFKNYIDKIPFEEHTWYINPNEKIYQNIIELTGITDEIILANAKTHAEIHDEIKLLINKYNCYPNPIVWGSGDVELLVNEIEDNVGHCHIFGHRDIDTKTIHTFNLLTSGKTSTKSSLKSALGYYKLKFEGTPHRAVDDARNTLNLFFNILDRQQKVWDIITRAQAIRINQ